MKRLLHSWSLDSWKMSANWKIHRSKAETHNEKTFWKFALRNEGEKPVSIFACQYFNCITIRRPSFFLLLWGSRCHNWGVKQSYKTPRPGLLERLIRDELMLGGRVGDGVELKFALWTQRGGLPALSDRQLQSTPIKILIDFLSRTSGGSHCSPACCRPLGCLFLHPELQTSCESKTELWSSLKMSFSGAGVFFIFRCCHGDVFTPLQALADSKPRLRFKGGHWDWAEEWSGTTSETRSDTRSEQHRLQRLSIESRRLMAADSSAPQGVSLPKLTFYSAAVALAWSAETNWE